MNRKQLALFAKLAMDHSDKYEAITVKTKDLHASQVSTILSLVFLSLSEIAIEMAKSKDSEE